VGEVNALRGLVPLLVGSGEEMERGLDVVISVGTDTGIARARDLFAQMDHVRIVRYPLDFSWSVRRFLDAVRPDAVALVELEVWPNFIRACEQRGVPVGVINGRLSARSFRGYRMARAALGRTFGRLAFAAVQDEAYAERFLRMGARAAGPVGDGEVGGVRVTGSMKWDAARIEDEVEGAAELAEALGIDRSRPLVVAGSTGPLPTNAPKDARSAGTPYVRSGPAFVAGGARNDKPMPELAAAAEEALLDAACPADVQLLCAPRKPERFDEAFAALGGAERCVRRSSGDRAEAGRTRFLLDTIGELRAAYALADVVIIGRSFGALYGSDPIEPVALGRPVVCGPRMADFDSSMGPLLDADAVVQVGAAGLAEAIEWLLGDDGERRAMGQRGRRVIREQQGATGRHAEMIRAMVGA
jgi:3-deoxy-D-manno-octulosonic-acid transferase